jgi:hypothetical protein
MSKGANQGGGVSDFFSGGAGKRGRGAKRQPCGSFEPIGDLEES